MMLTLPARLRLADTLRQSIARGRIARLARTLDRITSSNHGGPSMAAYRQRGPREWDDKSKAAARQKRAARSATTTYYESRRPVTLPRVKFLELPDVDCEPSKPGSATNEG